MDYLVDISLIFTHTVAGEVDVFLKNDRSLTTDQLSPVWSVEKCSEP